MTRHGTEWNGVDAMACHAMPFSVISRRARAMQCNAIQCNAMYCVSGELVQGVLRVRIAAFKGLKPEVLRAAARAGGHRLHVEVLQ